MPDGAGGNKPDPDEVDRELRRLTEEVGKSRVREPSALERMVAARQAEKKAQRKKDSRVLVLLVLAVLVIAGGGVATWLRIAPPSWFHHRTGGHPAAPTAAPKVRLTTTPLNPVTSNGPGADPFSGSPAG